MNPAHPKIWRPNLSCIFGQLSPAAVTQLTANLTSEWSGGSMFHSLSHIYTKTPFCCIKTVANLQFTIGWNEFVEFFLIFQNNCRIWVIWAFSIICICTSAFKVSIPPLNCFAWTVFFSPQEAMLYQHMKFRFFHCFENLQQ